MKLNPTPIQMEWFYDIYGHKTKFNWFLMEYAMDYYMDIMGNEQLEFYRKQYSKTQIAHYCTYFAKRMNPVLLKVVRRQRKSMCFYHEHISDIYPHLAEDQIDLLCTVAVEVWNNMLPNCSHGCTQRCLADYASRSHNFEHFAD